MAKNIKVQYTEITNILGEVQKRLEDINTTYKNINKNSTLIEESWQSAAAQKTVNKIQKQSKDLKKAVNEIKKEKDLINKTSKKVIESDKKLAKQFQSALN